MSHYIPLYHLVKQRMKFIFHNSYVIIELVPIAEFFWTELSCSTNKATLLLGWSHRYKNDTVVITIWLTVTKYSYIKWQCIFLRRCFLSSITVKTFTGTAYHSRAPEFNLGFFVGSVLFIFLFFVSIYVSLRYEFRVVMSITIST